MNIVSQMPPLPPAPLRVMDLRSTYRWGGGPDKTVLNSAKFHDPQRVWTLVTYLRADWDDEFVLADRARSMGLTVEEIVEHSAIDFGALKQVVALLKKYDIQILHSRDYKTNLFALLIKRFWMPNLKIITMAHGWVGGGLKLSFYYTLDKIWTSLFDRNLLLFNAQRAQFILKPRPSRCVVVHNAIIDDEWSCAKVERGGFRAEMGIDAQRFVVGFVGRIMPEKDIVTMVRVAHRLINELHLPLLFVLVGESKTGEYGTAVEREISRYGLGEHVVLAGKRLNPRQVYRDFDMFLMTSLQEGFPNSLLEAMAMEVPAVVSAVDGIPEIVTHEKHCLLCQPKDVEGFVRSIERLYRDAALAQRLSNSARALVENELSFTNRLRKMEAVFHDLVFGTTYA